MLGRKPFKKQLSNEKQSLIKFVIFNKECDQEVQRINLIEEQLINPIYFLPKIFIITTQNGSYKFNIDMIKDTSSVIKQFISKNPTKYQFHTSINDEFNIMGKIERLYQGELVTFSSDELFLSKKIIKILDLICFPKFINDLTYGEKIDDFDKYKLMVEKKSFLTFLQKLPKTFTIRTNKTNYKCNCAGINASNTISQLIQNDIINHQLNHYVYNFDDKNDEFKVICNFFNYLSIRITPKNYQIIKKISIDLQIECLYDIIEEFNNNYIYTTQILNEHRQMIESINMLTELLYNRLNLNLEAVSNIIINSIWCENEQNVQEMAAYFYQAIITEVKIHQHLINLLILLDLCSNQKVHLKQLIPFLSQVLCKNMGYNHLICDFIYQLYQKGFISKEKIAISIRKNFKTNNNILIKRAFTWFFPELIETNTLSIETIIENIDLNQKKFIASYYPSKIEQFKKMRENGISDDELTKAIKNDDDDKMKSLITDIPINDIQITYNIFDCFYDVNKTKIINYCALQGSVKCFKYLLGYNNGEYENIGLIDENTLQCSCINYNIEIYQIIIKIFVTKLIKYNIRTISNLLTKYKIERHMKGNFYRDVNLNLAYVTAISGNIDHFIKLIDGGIDISILSNKDILNIIFNASSSGFYTLTNILFNIIFKNKSNKTSQIFAQDPLSIIHFPGAVSFGNIFIFKLYDSLNIEKIDFIYPLQIAILNEFSDIVHYAFESPFRQKFDISENDALFLIKQSFYNHKIDLYNYLSNQLFNVEKIIKYFSHEYYNSLINEACTIGNIEITKILYELIINKNPNFDFSNAFYMAAEKDNIEICNYLISKNVKVNTIKIHLSKIPNKQTALLLLDAIDPEKKDIFLEKILYESIVSKQNYIVQLLLEKGAPHIDALFLAVSQNNTKMVDIILKYDSTPSFVNQISKYGTALHIAVQNNNIEICKLLLSIKGINPSLYNEDNQTPLITAFKEFNLNIINLLFDFYGDNIKSQIWQFNEALKLILKIINENHNYFKMKDEEHKQSSFCNNARFERRYYLFTKFTQIEKSKITKEQEIDVINKLLEIDEIDEIDINYTIGNYNLLCYACKFNQIEIAKKIIQSKKCNVNQYLLENGNSPLMVAIGSNNVEIAELILNQQETNINHQNYMQDTALILAVKYNLPKIVNLLISDKRFDQIESQVNHAFLISNDEISKQLISIKELNINLYDDRIKFTMIQQLETPLIVSAYYNYIEKVDLIIHCESFDPIKSQVKKAIQIACQKNHFEIFKKLLPFINNDVNTSLNEESLLVTASKNKSIEIIIEIINNPNFDSAKSNINEACKCLLDTEDIDIHLIDVLRKFDREHSNLINFNKLSNGKSYFTSIVSKDLKVNSIIYLLKEGVDPDIPDAFGEYPLQTALKNYYEYAAKKSYENINTLINSGKINLSRRVIDINYHQKVIKTTYLHLAAKNDQQIFKKILNFNLIDINATDTNGDTPLMIAARNKNIENIKILFQKENLDYLHQNKKGENVIDIWNDETSSNQISFEMKTKKEYLDYFVSSHTKSLIAQNE